MERAYETPLRGAVVAMEEYRVYTVGPDGHIIGVERWFALMTKKQSKGRGDWSIATTSSFGAAPAS
jgi:hypothetical protein